MKTIKKNTIIFQTAERKVRIIFLEQSNQSDGRFLKPIVKSLKGRYDVKYLRTLNIIEAKKAIDWADVVWLEWANQLTVYLTNKLPQLKEKKVICRLHGYEVFTNMPAQIKWIMLTDLSLLRIIKKKYL